MEFFKGNKTEMKRTDLEHLENNNKPLNGGINGNKKTLSNNGRKNSNYGKYFCFLIYDFWL